MTTNGRATGEALRLFSLSVSASEESGESVPILEDVTLALYPGEWLNLVGVNGSGKSTLARVLAGFYVEGASGSLDRGFAGATVAPVVLQRPEAQLFGETPREEVAFALEWRQTPTERILEMADDMLAAVGLGELADRRWEEFSGGQKQLAAVAAATAGQPALLIFDEATSMLDDANRQAVVRLAREKHRQGAAIVWVTQRLDEIGPDDRTVAMSGGCIRFDGDGRTFFYGTGGAMPPCLACGLRLPYSAELALALRERGRLSDPLPVTESEWRQALGDVGEDAKLGGKYAGLPVRRIDELRLRLAGDRLDDEAGAADAMLQLEPGTITLLMGPNGAGKSVFLEKMAGLRDPEGRKVAYGHNGLWIDKRIFPGKRLNGKALRDYGYAAQSPEQAMFRRTLEEEIDYSLRPYESKERFDRGFQIDQALASVGWDRGWLGKDPYRLSGGERRRAALAALFATPAPWLLLDEPTAGLDRDGHEKLAAYLRRLKGIGRGIVLVSHDLDWAIPLADRVLLLQPDGRVADGCTEALLGRPAEWDRAGMHMPAWLRYVSEAGHKAGTSASTGWSPAEAAEILAGRLFDRTTASRSETGAENKVRIDERGPAGPAITPSRRRVPDEAPHRLTRFDPRAVWLGYVLLSIGLFSLSTWPGLAAGLALSAALIAAGGIPLRRWRGMIIGYGCFGVLLAAFAALDIHWSMSHPLGWDAGVFTGTLFPFTRTMAVLLIGLGLPLVLTPLSLRRALQQPFDRAGRTPAFWQRIVLTVTLTIRFVPVLLAEWERFRRIFLARGKETGGSPRTIVRRLRESTVPLLLSLFRLADEVALALESRGVRPDVHPTQSSRLKWGWRDTAFTAGAALLGGVMWMLD